MKQKHRAKRKPFLVIVIAVGALVAALIVTNWSISSSTQSASAADGANFTAGNIISDSNFYNSSAMTASEIQTFLNAEVPTCDTWHAQDGDAYAPPYTCLKDYSVTIAATSADSYCSAIAAGTYSAASIIDKVSRACGISQKVMLVLLQKEQGLVTDTWPSNTQYNKATGFDCPDTAPCSSSSSGFFKQIYAAARQFQVYAANPTSFNYRANAWNTIYWSPNTACGTTSVYIQNQATASLYIYTPYTPNAAALSNLYGTGDSCSSYGNRNFWRLYTDWFGDPTGTSYQVLGEMGARYAAIGGSSGVLGSPIANEVCNWTTGSVNCYQNFQYGAISWTPSTGAWETLGLVRTRWQQLGFEYGVLGYPVGPPECITINDGCYQNFQNGAISTSPASGTWETYGVIRTRWGQTGFETGPLGYPIGAPTTTSSGTYQNYQNGAISWSSSTGAWETYGVSRTRWSQLGFENGVLGYPASSQKCTLVNSGCYQNYQNGAIVWSSATSAWESYGIIRAYWGTVGYENSFLGYPTGAVTSTSSSSSYQNYQNGTIATSGSGTFEVRASINARWKATGGQSGALGSPTANEVCSWTSSTPNCYQTFDGGTIYWTADTGAWEVYGAIATRWTALGGGTGVLGYPRTGYTCGTVNGGCYENFQNGAISWTSSTGAWETYGIIRTYWQSQGFESGALGYPTGAVTTTSTGLSQTFQGGTVTWNKSTNIVSKN